MTHVIRDRQRSTALVNDIDLLGTRCSNRPQESMKTTGVFLIGLLLLLKCAAYGTQIASATLFCWSLKFSQGSGAFDETLDLSTAGGTPNGELSPWYSTYTHRSGFALDFSGFPITGALYLDLPPNPDANGNGFDDSLEVSQAAGGTSEGEYITSIGGGSVTATWSRAAGSNVGTCWLHLVDDSFGDLGTFRHTFEVLEFTGQLAYTPGDNTVSTTLNLTNATDQLQGPLAFTKASANPYNNLTLQSGFLTNAAGQTLTLYRSSSFLRDATLLTNYYGAMEFNDGDPNTVAEDYFTWELSIDDLNDQDHDTIPDFSDKPAVTIPPRRPLLSLVRGETNLVLTISGDTGRQYHVLESSSPIAGNWSTNLSLTLTNDPQTLFLPLPSGGARFWRTVWNSP